METESKLLECVWISINLDNNDKLMIGCIYRSPSLGIGCIGEIKQIFTMSKSYGCSHICILGDFNYKEINWTSNECTADFNHPANNCLDAVNDNFLTQHVHSPTRFRENETPLLLDLVFTNEEGMIDNISHRHGLGKSDHIILIISFVCYTRIQNRRNYHEANYTQIIQYQLFSCILASSDRLIFFFFFFFS